MPWIAVAALAAVTWVVTVMPAWDMGNGPGIRGLAPLPSLGLWVVMMAATMLPFRAALASSTPKSPAALQLHGCQQPPDQPRLGVNADTSGLKLETGVKKP